MRAYIEQFQMFLAAERGLSVAYQLSILQSLDHLAKWLENNHLSITNMTSKSLIDFMLSMDNGHRKRNTRRLEMMHIRLFFNWLHRRHFIGINPAATLELPKLDIQLPETLDEKVVQQLLESTSSTDLPLGTRDRAILELLYGCGIRVSELVNLLIEHYNPKEQFLRVTGKGHKTRFVPVGTKAVEALNLYLNQARPTLVKPRSRSFIFLSRRGTQLTRERIRQIIRERAKQAGIDDRVYPHLMRHSFATHLLHHGADLRIIQELLGHADISTTQIYTHVDESTLRSIHSQFHPRNKIPINSFPPQNKRDE